MADRHDSVELHVVDDPDAAADLVARLLVDAVRARSSIALSGGATPRAAYERAAALYLAAGRRTIATAYLAEARRAWTRYGAGARVATLFSDSGARYLSTLYDDAWMRRHGYLEPVASAPAAEPA